MTPSKLFFYKAHRYIQTQLPIRLQKSNVEIYL